MLIGTQGEVTLDQQLVLEREQSEHKRLSGISSKQLESEIRSAIRTKGESNRLTTCVGISLLSILRLGALDSGNDPYCRFSARRAKIGRRK